MKNGESMNMDGLPCEFYEPMWDTIGDCFYFSASKIFTLGSLTKLFNKKLIKIILKNA